MQCSLKPGRQLLTLRGIDLVDPVDDSILTDGLNRKAHETMDKLAAMLNLLSKLNRIDAARHGATIVTACCPDVRLSTQQACEFTKCRKLRKHRGCRGRRGERLLGQGPADHGENLCISLQNCCLAGKSQGSRWSLIHGLCSAGARQQLARGNQVRVSIW